MNDVFLLVIVIGTVIVLAVYLRAHRSATIRRKILKDQQAQRSERYRRGFNALHEDYEDMARDLRTFGQEFANAVGQAASVLGTPIQLKPPTREEPLQLTRPNMSSWNNTPQTYSNENSALNGVTGLRCFISYRSDKQSKRLVDNLQKMFESLEVQSTSSVSAKPRSVSDKVLARQKDPFDLFIVILSPSGDLTWLRHEIDVAKARNLPVLVLAEKPMTLNSGPLGDTKLVTFSSKRISDAFLEIVDMLKYVAQRKYRA